MKGLQINHLNTGPGTCLAPTMRSVPVDNQHRATFLNLRLHDISIRYAYPYLLFFSCSTPVSPLSQSNWRA